MDTWIELNAPKVICEEIDGELILLHFELGFYYSVRGSGAWVCRTLLAGSSTDQVAENLSVHFNLPKEAILQHVDRFVNELAAANLVEPSHQPAQGASGPVEIPITLGAYDPPAFEKFDDMADQLLLDKIDQPS